MAFLSLPTNKIFPLMKKPLTFAGILMLGFVLVRCSVGKQCTDTLAQGTYRYSHGWEYQYGGNWVAVKEEGTMAFHPDGTGKGFYAGGQAVLCFPCV